jgi:hypothetical protein
MAKMIYTQHPLIVVGILDYKHASIIEVRYPTLLDGKFPGHEASKAMS